MEKERGNIIAFRRDFQLHIGIVICVVIFVYVVCRLLSFVASPKITVYEVKAGSIVSDNTFRALIIREEEIVPAELNGSVYYFAPQDSRVGVRTPVYAVDEDGSIINTILANNSVSGELSEETFKSSRNVMSGFVNEYQPAQFQKTYRFKAQLSDTLNALQVDAIMQEHAQEIADATARNTYHSYNAARPGLISYMIDDFSDVTEHDFDPAVFSGNPEIHNLKSRTSIEAGEPAYKLIISDDWKLVVPVDLKTRDKLAEESAIQLTFLSDGMKAWASCSVLEKDEVPYLVLSLDDSMERYANMRFVEIELLLDEKEGLKVPDSAIIDKEFYTIPKSYFLNGNGSEKSTDLGVLVSTDNGNEFMSPVIYKETESSYYIDEEEIPKGTELIKPDSLETYTVGNDVDTLKGVYNINKGYAVFKQIEVIQENEDYTLIRTGTPYGLAMYDRIALQGNRIRDNEIIGR